MRALRFRSAILAAVCAHAVLVAAVHRSHGRSSVPADRDAAELIVVETEPAPAPLPVVEPPEPLAGSAPVQAQNLPIRTADAKPRAPSHVSSSPDVAAADSVLTAPAPSAFAANDGWSLPAPTRTSVPGLSTDGYWKTVAMASPSAGVPGERESPSAALQRGLREELDAHDQDVGLGSSGPLVAAAHDAASGESAPDVGVGVIEIDCDATGHLVFARADSDGPDSAAWASVARELTKLMANKTVRVPPGARGVRTRIRIAAVRTLPSGEKREIGAGAVPAGACAGTGLTRRCGAGLPLGTSGTFGDVSNLGAKRTRVVHVQVLDEVAIR